MVQGQTFGVPPLSLIPFASLRVVRLSVGMTMGWGVIEKLEKPQPDAALSPRRLKPDFWKPGPQT